MSEHRRVRWRQLRRGFYGRQYGPHFIRGSGLRHAFPSEPVRYPHIGPRQKLVALGHGYGIRAFRASRFCTAMACQCPPRAVRIPRVLRPLRSRKGGGRRLATSPPARSRRKHQLLLEPKHRTHRGHRTSRCPGAGLTPLLLTPRLAQTPHGVSPIARPAPGAAQAVQRIGTCRLLSAALRANAYCHHSEQPRAF